MTWLQFVNKVKENIPVDAVRKNTASMFLAQLKAGTRRVQQLVPYFQKGHVTWFDYAVSTENGYTSVFTMPTGDEDVRPVRAELINLAEDYETEPCYRTPLHDYPWNHRHDLSCGEHMISNCQFAISWDRKGGEFWVYPKLESDEEVEVRLEWDGVKSDYADGDDVNYDDDVAIAVANYVKSWFAKEVHRDREESGEYMKDFRRDMQLIHTTATERVRQRDTTDTPQGTGRVSCTAAICTSS